MQPTRLGWLCGVMAICLVAACSEAGADTTTTAAEPPATTTTTSPPPTTAPPVTSTTAASTTTTIDTGLVGDPDALIAMIEQTRGFALGEGETQYEGVAIPYPDLTNPDPVVALREAWSFEAWLMDTGPFIGFLDAHNYPEGPRRRDAGSDFIYWDLENLRLVGLANSYSLTSAEVVPLESADMLEPERIEVPPSSVAVAYTDRGGPYQVIDTETGQVIEEVAAYEDTGVAVLVPTEVGWQLYWAGEASE